jgi:hypothetical protein
MNPNPTTKGTIMNHKSRAERLRRRAEYRRASDSPFNHKANEIVEKLRAVEAEILELVNAHSDGCECDFCGCTTMGCTEHVTEDLKGLAWCLSMTLGSIDTAILPTPEMKEKNEAEFLAEMRAKK